MEVVSISGLYEGGWDYQQMVDMRFVEALSAELSACEGCGECAECTFEAQ